MKKAKGFILLGELLCFTLSAVLLLAAAQAFSRSIAAVGYADRLQQSWQAARLAAVGEEYDSGWQCAKSITGNNGIKLLEVQVKDEQGKIYCSLLRALP